MSWLNVFPFCEYCSILIRVYSDISEMEREEQEEEEKEKHEKKKRRGGKEEKKGKQNRR